ncbi:MAG: oligosaccharide flippase family protein [Deltaproteobacteria bacterium]|nr:oligosaccharide flippase family protein [Deltaproteobacteria bacterium]
MGYDQELKKGAIINLFGLLAKLVHPLLLLIIPWLFGTEVMGLYFLAVFLIDIINYLIYSGYCDATSIFASKYADKSDPASKKELYRIFSNAFAIPTGLGIIIVAIGLFVVEPFVGLVYPDRPELVNALKILVWTVPMLSLSSICIAGTKALMKMQYDVLINSTMYPLLLLALMVVAWWLNLGLIGLMIARLISQIVVLVLSLWAYGKHFSLGVTFKNIMQFKFDREMFRFVLPQNLNMTFNRYITRLDVLMLGAFGFSNHAVAFYSAGALITSNVREVKQIFTSILGPIIARHHASGSSSLMTDDLSKVVRWTTSLGVPVILTILILRNDVLLLMDKSFNGDTLFMAILLMSPFLSCAMGMAGNCIVWTRHSSWNLVNSLSVAGINTLLNWVMIPWLGLTGAALATITASTIVSFAQVAELYYLEKVYIRPSAVYKPWIGLGIFMAAIFIFGDPSKVSSIWIRVAMVPGMILLFFFLMVLIRHPEALSYAKRLKQMKFLNWFSGN